MSTAKATATTATTKDARSAAPRVADRNDLIRGKSSLVFGTIAAESQRMINETYSAFVQGFMPTRARPEVDVLDGLTTAIIVDQERMGAPSSAAPARRRPRRRPSPDSAACVLNREAAALTWAAG